MFRLALIAQAPTAAIRAAAFPADEPLDGPGLVRARAHTFRGRTTAGLCWTSPALAARQTAEALGLQAEGVDALRECGYGAWAGQLLARIEAADPDGVASWLSEPESCPHGGESLLELIGRVAGWLATAVQEGSAVAVTHASVVRAAIVVVLQAPPQAFWRIDVAPLSVTRLRRHAGRWSLGSTGRPLPRAAAPPDGRQ